MDTLWERAVREAPDSLRRVVRLRAFQTDLADDLALSKAAISDILEGQYLPKDRNKFFTQVSDMLLLNKAEKTMFGELLESEFQARDTNAIQRSQEERLLRLVITTGYDSVESFVTVYKQLVTTGYIDNTKVS